MMQQSKIEKIALLLDACHWGGIEQHVLTLAEALQQESDVKVCIILWQQYPNSSVSERMRQEFSGDLHYAYGSYSKLCRLLQLHAVTILHCHGYKANLVGRIVKIHQGLRVISTHHNGDIGRGRVRLYTLLDQLTCFLVENWVVSKAIQQRLKPTRSSLIKNFVSVKEQPNQSQKEKQKGVLFVGRLVSIKRPDRFVRLAKQNPNMSFHIIGDGELAIPLKAQSSTNLHWHGYQSKASQVWRHGDVCVICSDDEGLPLTALEAMARGIPVIATAVGQLPQLIEHGINGWLVHNEQQLNDAVSHWYSITTEQRQSISFAAQQTFTEQYSVSACLPSYLKLYGVSH